MTAHAKIVVEMTATGQLDIPQSLRHEMGLDGGGPVVLRVEDGELRIRNARDVLVAMRRRSKALFAPTGDSVDAFLRDRRKDADDEAA